MADAIATNKKAYRDYFLSDFRECGIALAGGEVKSVRAGHVNFTDAFALITKGEVFLYNLRIDPYAQASYLNTPPERSRKLLLHKKEISKLAGQTTSKGVVLVPTKIYFNKRGIVKVEIAIGKGKKSYDKRETIKKREVDQDLRRRMKQK
jgi:SsrA-binding protein